MDRRLYRVSLEFSVPESVELGPGVVLAAADGVPPVIVTLATGLWPILRLRLEEVLESSGDVIPRFDYETEGLGGT